MYDIGWYRDMRANIQCRTFAFIYDIATCYTFIHNSFIGVEYTRHADYKNNVRDYHIIYLYINMWYSTTERIHTYSTPGSLSVDTSGYLSI
jgi:hypothetical protein